MRNSFVSACAWDLQANITMGVKCEAEKIFRAVYKESKNSYLPNKRRDKIPRCCVCILIRFVLEQTLGLTNRIFLLLIVQDRVEEHGQNKGKDYVGLTTA